MYTSQVRAPGEGGGDVSKGGTLRAQRESGCPERSQCRGSPQGGTLAMRSLAPQIKGQAGSLGQGQGQAKSHFLRMEPPSASSSSWGFSRFSQGRKQASTCRVATKEMRIPGCRAEGGPLGLPRKPGGVGQPQSCGSSRAQGLYLDGGPMPGLGRKVRVHEGVWPPGASNVLSGWGNSTPGMHWESQAGIFHSCVGEEGNARVL